jgi:hypothetical protein
MQEPSAGAISGQEFGRPRSPFAAIYGSWRAKCRPRNVASATAGRRELHTIRPADTGQSRRLGGTSHRGRGGDEQPPRAHPDVREQGAQESTKASAVRPSGLAFETNRLVVAGGSADVAERQAVFDEGGSAPSVTVDHDRVLAYGTVERFRVYALASGIHASPTDAASLLRPGRGCERPTALTRTIGGLPAADHAPCAPIWWVTILRRRPEPNG